MLAMRRFSASHVLTAAGTQADFKVISVVWTAPGWTWKQIIRVHSVHPKDRRVRDRMRPDATTFEQNVRGARQEPRVRKKIEPRLRLGPVGVP